MPTSNQVQTVIDNFKKVLPEAILPHHLNMQEGEVNCYYACGTTHCHGGWYAITTCDLSKPIDYEAGANQMAVDLGFSNKEKLKVWAHKNPALWGNTAGDGMFHVSYAFASKDRPGGAQTLQHIIDHWEEVRQRLMQIEFDEACDKEKERQ